MFAAERLGWVSLLPGDWVHGLTFTMNYRPHRGWTLSHLWSLSVEEQFYFLWPATLALLGVARGLQAAAGVVVLCPLIRLGLWFAAPGYREFVGESFETVADAIAIGCVLAGTRERLGQDSRYRAVLSSRAFAFVALAANAQSRHPLSLMFVGTTVVNVSIALHRLVRQEPRRADWSRIGDPRVPLHWSP